MAEIAPRFREDRRGARPRIRSIDRPNEADTWSEFGNVYTNQFSRPNTVTNFVDWMGGDQEFQTYHKAGEQFEPEVDFDPFQYQPVIEADDKVWFEFLKDTQSQAEADHVLGMLRERDIRTAALQEPGAFGLIGTLSGYIVDPLELPLLAARGPYGFAFGVAAIVAKEVFLQSVNRRRPIEESFINVVGAGAISLVALRLQRYFASEGIDMGASAGAAKKWDDVNRTKSDDPIDGAASLGGRPTTQGATTRGKRRVEDAVNTLNREGKYPRTGVPYPVIINPSKRDMLRLYKKASSEPGRAKGAPGTIRYLIHPDTGELHIWDGYLATHDQLERFLGVSVKESQAGSIRLDGRGRLIAGSGKKGIGTGRIFEANSENIDKLLEATTASARAGLGPIIKVAPSQRVADRQGAIAHIRLREEQGGISTDVANEMVKFMEAVPDAFISGAAFLFREYGLTAKEIAARNAAQGVKTSSSVDGLYNQIYDLVIVFTGKNYPDPAGVLRHEAGHRVLDYFVDAAESARALKIYGGIPMGKEIDAAFLSRYPRNEQYKEWFAEGFNTYWKGVVDGTIPRAREGMAGIFEEVAGRLLETIAKVRGIALSEEQMVTNLFRDITRRGDAIDTKAFLAIARTTQAAAEKKIGVDWKPTHDLPPGGAASLSPGEKIKGAVKSPVAKEFELAPAKGLENLGDSPMKRMAHPDASPQAKRLLPRLAEIPVYLKGNFAGKALGRGVDRLMAINWIAPMTQAMRTTEDLYKQYRVRMGAQTVHPVTAFDQPGTMNKVAFLKHVGQAKKALDDPARLANFEQEAIAAAREWDSKLYGPLGAAAKRMKMFSIEQRRNLTVLEKEHKSLDDVDRGFGLEGPDAIRFKELSDEIKLLKEEIKALDNIEIKPSFLNRIYDKNAVQDNYNQLFDLLLRYGRTRSEAKMAIEGILGQRALSAEEEILGHGREAVGRAHSLRTRTLDDIPDHELEFVLESNIFSVGNYYARRMGMDVELTREFRSIDLWDQLNAIRAYWDNKISKATKAKGNSAASKKSIKDMEKRRNQELEDVRAVRDRNRGTFGLPDDPNTYTSRTIRAGKMVNAMTLLTGALAQIPDVAMLPMVNGFRRTFGASLETLFDGVQNLKLSKADANLAGEALDMYHSTRAAIYADMGEIMGTTSTFERGLSKGTQLFFTASGMNPWNVGVKTLASLFAGSRIYDEALALSLGKANAGMIRRLARANINKETAAAIVAQFDQFGLKGNHVKIAKAGEWTDQAAKEAYLAALGKEINLTIITPGKAEIPNMLGGGLERLPGAKSRKQGRQSLRDEGVPLTPLQEIEDLFMGPGMSQMIFQFKTFTASASARILTPGLQAGDMDTLFGAVSLVALGGMVDAIRRHQLGTPETSTGDRLWSAVERSAVLGYLGDIPGIMHSLVDPRFGMASKIGVFGGPIVQQGTNLGNVMLDTLSGNTDKGTVDSAVRLLPMNRVFFLNDQMRWLRDSGNEMVR